MKGRRGELPKTHDRSDRVYRGATGWYFKTREGITVGPYKNEFDAKLGASLLVSKLRQLDRAADPRNEIHAFARDPDYGPNRVNRAELRERALARLEELKRQPINNLRDRFISRFRSAVDRITLPSEP